MRRDQQRVPPVLGAVAAFVLVGSVSIGAAALTDGHITPTAEIVREAAQPAATPTDSLTPTPVNPAPTVQAGIPDSVPVAEVVPEAAEEAPRTPSESDQSSSKNSYGQIPASPECLARLQSRVDAAQAKAQAIWDRQGQITLEWQPLYLDEFEPENARRIAELRAEYDALEAERLPAFGALVEAQSNYGIAKLGVASEAKCALG